MLDRVMIIVAGGSSVRFGSDKLMTEVAGLPLVAHTVAAVKSHVDLCVLVSRQDQLARLEQLGLGVVLVPGGSHRTGSEMCGLDAIPDQARLIGIHDGARPLVPSALVEELFTVADRVGGAVPVLPMPLPLVTRSAFSPVPGAALAQTPQVFRAEPLLSAYAEARRQGETGHDTAEIVTRFTDVDIAAVKGDPGNVKVTTPRDLEKVRVALGASRSGPR